MITPNDIETKVFSYSVRGYNKREVDEFLDQIMIDYQALLDQNAKMLERVHVLQKQVTEAKDPARMTRDAKRLMNDISASAEQQAQVIIKNAKHDAENIVRNAKDSTSQADEDAERLRRKVEKFKLRYKQMLEDEIARMDDSSEDLLDDLRKDFFPGYLYGEGNASEYTKVVDSTPVDDIIAELPDVEPEDEAVEPSNEEPVIETYEAEVEEEAGEEAEEEPAEEADEEVSEETAEEETEEEPLEEEAEEEAEEQEETEEEESDQGVDDSEEADQLGEEKPEEAEDAEEAAADEAAEDAEEDAADEAEDAEEDDPLLARAKAANVDIDDLPGFRSSKDDTVVIKKKASEATMDITEDITDGAAEEADAPQAQDDLAQAAEKAKELKETATKFVSDIFSKKDK